MANRVQNLPFTAYDILGYLVPGVTLFVLSAYAWHGLKVFERINLGFIKLGEFSLVLVGVVLAYAAGHCIALVAAFTLERFVIIAFNYPSIYLVSSSSVGEGLRPYKDKIWSALFSFVFSVVPCSAIFVLSVSPFRGHFIKPLEGSCISRLDTCLRAGFDLERCSISGAGWFALIQQKVLMVSSVGSLRMYNYLNLYGFCRNMSVCLGFVACVSIASWHYNADAPRHIILFIICISCSSAILAFGFVKFFRRYSQGAIMTFIVLDEFCPIKKEDAVS